MPESATSPALPESTDPLAIAPAELAALAAPPARDPARGLLEGMTFGSWQLGELLGAGGMGDVYRATHTGDGRAAALKVLRAAPWLSATMLARFRREARVARAIAHPNVVQVLEVGEHRGAWWLAMSLCEGRSLQRWVEANGPLPWRLALRAVAQAACGLQAAHDNCIVHRDVKPANLLLGTDGRVQVADFGVAADPGTTGGLTLTGQALGTPAFMSPEQCTAAAVDARSDLYALGATLLFCCTGRPPFVPGTAGGALALLEQQVRTPAPRADQLNPAVPPSVAALIAKLLEKRPEARYQTAAALVADCATVLAGGEPTLVAGDDSSAHYTRAFVETDVADAEVEACLAEQAAARGRGERPVPLGEMLARRGAMAFRPRAARVAGRAERALWCPACASGAPVAELGIPVPACPACGGALAASGGIVVGAAFGRLVFVPPAAGAGLGDLLVPLVAAALEAGCTGVAVDCSALGRLEAGETLWITDCCEMLLAEGGSLALIVPEARARAFLAAVGIDQYVRVVESRPALMAVAPPAAEVAPEDIETTPDAVAVHRDEPTPVA